MNKMDVQAFISKLLATQRAARAMFPFAVIGMPPRTNRVVYVRDRALPGTANAVPTARKGQYMASNIAIPAVTTVKHKGILTCPALAGFTSPFSSFAVAFISTATPLLVVAASARLMTR